MSFGWCHVVHLSYWEDIGLRLSNEIIITLANTPHLHNNSSSTINTWFKNGLSLFYGADTLAQEAVYVATPSQPPT